MTQQNTSVDHAALKIGTAWVATAFTSWADVAAFLAAGYTFCLWCEWIWKRFGRSFAEGRGWIKRIKRRKDDADVD